MYVLQHNCMNLFDKKFQLIDKAFNIIQKTGWESFSFEKLAKEEKISLLEISKILKTKSNLLQEFSLMIDFNVEKNFNFKDLESSSVKDNLFELIMLRLELMTPYKRALNNITNIFKNDISASKKVSSSVLSSLDFYLELTNSYDGSFVDIIKKHSVLVIYARTFMIWMNDDSDEMTKTMSELDKMLSFSEKAIKSFKEYFPI